MIRTFFLTLFYTGPMVIIGLLVCCTVVGIPIGFAIMVAGCKPLAKQIGDDFDTAIKKRMSQYEEDDFMSEYNNVKEVPKPWKI